MRAMRAIAILQLAKFFYLQFFILYIIYIIYNINIITHPFYYTIQIPFGAHGARGALSFPAIWWFEKYICTYHARHARHLVF